MVRVVYGLLAVVGLVAIVARNWFANAYTSTNVRSSGTDRKRTVAAGYARTVAVLVGALLVVAGVLGALGIHR